MAYSRRKKKSSRKNKKSEIFQNIGAAWENETRNGDILISLKLDIEDFLDWLDLMKIDKLPDEETKLSVILLEQTKSKKRGAPDFVVYGLDPTLPEEEEEDEKPRRRKKKARREEEEEEEKPRRRKKKVREEEEPEEEEDEKPKRKKSKRAKKVKEEEEELDLDFEEEND